MNLKQEIDVFLDQNKDEIVRNLCRLVRIPSIAEAGETQYPYGSECAKALDFCMEVCREKDLVVKNYEYRCAEARLKDEQSGKRLLLAAHCDVVPAEAENLYPPFGGTVAGDYVVGRGVVDDKGPLIATLYAMAFLKEKGIELKNDVRLYFGSNEETGMDDMTYYLDQAGQPDWGLAVDDDFPVTNGEKGLIRFTLRSKKHAGLLSAESEGGYWHLIHDRCTLTWKGASAVEIQTEQVANPVARGVMQHGPLLEHGEHARILAELVQDTRGALAGIDRCDEKSGGTLLRIYEVHTQGEDLVFYFDVRLPVTFPVEEAKTLLEGFARESGMEIDIFKVSPGYFVPEEQEIVSLLTGLYNRESGSDDKPYVMGACTYARLFENGCGFGGGNPREVKPFPAGHGGAHGPDEAHSITVLLTAIQMYILGILAVDEHWG